MSECIQRDDMEGLRVLTRGFEASLGSSLIFHGIADSGDKIVFWNLYIFSKIKYSIYPIQIVNSNVKKYLEFWNSRIL